MASSTGLRECPVLLKAYSTFGGTSVCDIVTVWQEQKENVRIVDYDLPIKSES